MKFLNLINNSFLKNTLILSSGTILAQVLPFVFYPILARIYTPEDFGLLSIVLGITPILAIIYSGMYEGAILISDNKKEGRDLIYFILLRSFKIFLIVYLGLIISRILFYNFLNSEYREIFNLLFFVPFCSFFIVIYNCFNEWCVTNKYFKILSLNKVFFTSSISTSKVVFGLSKLLNYGLIWGDLVGKLLTSLYCIYASLKNDYNYFIKFSRNSFKILKTKYINFPKFLLPDQLINNISGSVHIFFIGLFFGKEELGYFTMSATLLTVPVTVITASIKDVFRQKATEIFKSKKNCRKLFIKTSIPISIIAFVFFIPLYFFLPEIFSFFLGDQWLKSAIYSQILIPMFIANFISMSLGGVLIVADKLHISFYWQLFNIVTTLFALIVGIFYSESMYLTIVYYMIVRTFSYIMYYLISFYYAKK